MKRFVLLSAYATLLLSNGACNQKKTKDTKYKGRLEIKGICYNYTIRLLEGAVDTSKINSTWRDEATGKIYTNVFGLADPCAFPPSIKEGDEFYFIIDTSKLNDCAVCEAYYPSPPLSLIIKVVDK
jgi:hypothetical protein